MSKKIILDCCGRPEGECVCPPEPDKQDNLLLTDKEIIDILSSFSTLKRRSAYVLHKDKAVAKAQLAKVLKLDRPKIICLCGSTRFTEQMLVKQWELTKQGFIVLSWCALPESYFRGEDKTHIGDQEGVKEIMDEVHLRKIDLADEVFVINANGYIGESTSREIDHAMKSGKPIKYLEVNNG